MGLSLCYEMHLPALTSEDDVSRLLDRLHAFSGTLGFEALSPIVRVAEGESTAHRGLAFSDLTKFFRVIAPIVAEPHDGDGYDILPRGEGSRKSALGFVVAPGRKCEAAPIGFVAPPSAAELALCAGKDVPAGWYWHWCCKTQYASVVSDEHLIRCHLGLVALLEEAARLGVRTEVRDETGYWQTRDTAHLVREVHRMNGIVAAFGGALSDAISPAADVHGAIFEHPDFEHLEMQNGER